MGEHKVNYDVRIFLDMGEEVFIASADSLEVVNGLLVVNSYPMVKVYPIANIIHYEFKINKE